MLSSTSGRPLDVANVRRAFRLITKKAGTGETWSPRELRHSFVSATSDGGLRIEAIADLCGHFSPAVSGEVYRQPPIGRSRPRRPGPLSHAAGPVAVRAVVAPVLADLDEHGFPVGVVARHNASNVFHQVLSFLPLRAGRNGPAQPHRHSFGAG